MSTTRSFRYHAQHPLEGDRRLAFMTLDADVVSPSRVYRVLQNAGLIVHHHSKPSLKGKGFQQSLLPHELWHTDVSYINIAGTFFYLCSLLDGCSRFLVHWEIASGPPPAPARASPPGGRIGAYTRQPIQRVPRPVYAYGQGK
jgi:putative transposase